MNPRSSQWEWRKKKNFADSTSTMFLLTVLKKMASIRMRSPALKFRQNVTSMNAKNSTMHWKSWKKGCCKPESRQNPKSLCRQNECAVLKKSVQEKHEPVQKVADHEKAKSGFERQIRHARNGLSRQPRNWGLPMLSWRPLQTYMIVSWRIAACL